ncbi:MAG: hypothetical protein JEY99_08170 [Spirochaetales bacterium]|nr:hypothetical protein [Spirochaetales bacterium]
MRTEIHYKTISIDGRIRHLKKRLESSSLPDVTSMAMADVYIIGRDDLPAELPGEIFSDPVAQKALTGKSAIGEGYLPDWTYAVEVSFKPGVTNPTAMTAKSALKAVLGKDFQKETPVQTARQYIFQVPDYSREDKERLAKVLFNPLIETAVILTKEEWDSGKRFPELYSIAGSEEAMTVGTYDLAALSDKELEDFSREKLLALSLDEMKALRDYYRRDDVIDRRKQRQMPEGPTDVELEMIAQTWSEHCKHKILNAKISYTEGETTEEINSLFKTYIKGTTDQMLESKPYLKSLFHDNAGVIEFDDENLLCFKVETHNSPSALDPYGGSITGIVGVNRDILGTGKGARPIFNTNVLCFGELDTPAGDIPEGLLSPKTIMHGVHQGIIDGGNQSGIPTVGGAFLFDEHYMGKPLVFCGTGGILPRKILGEDGWVKHVRPGTLAVMLGGRIGKDGIHGATFSSLVLDEESPTSAVQIGDPITQKRMSDFLIEARDRGLYEGITDNGAGGLSSSMGEMAEESNGLRVDLDKCPLKYQGLAPWEIWVSESQERMSLAINPATLNDFMVLAEKRDVEATVIGEFTDSGLIELFYKGEIAAEMELEFIHDGLPVMALNANWQPPARPETPAESEFTSGEMLKKLLSEFNIASKEALVRQYDHEVQIQSVQKPFVGAKSDAPSDGAVLRPVANSSKGVTITHGICPRYSVIDTYNMAACALDEAFRAHIGMGGNPDLTSALDNFCWPDPVESERTPDGQYKLAQAVRACRGLQDTCLAYGIPLISGKDSMKNDAQLGGKKVSVKPTLLISLMGIMDDYKKTVSSDFKNTGDLVLVAGETRGEMGGTFYNKILKDESGRVPGVDTKSALALYRKLYKAIGLGLVASCHDLSDGGFGVAAAESAIGGRLGARLDLGLLPGGPSMETMSTDTLLYCETPSRFLISVKPEKLEEFRQIMEGSFLSVIGEVEDTGNLTVTRVGNPVFTETVENLAETWKSPLGKFPEEEVK